VKQKPQTFNDGVCGFYSVKNTAAAAKKPVETLELKRGGIRYTNRTVGISRFWSAKQANVQIDRLLRMPYCAAVSTQDVAVTEDGTQYSIKQIQCPEDIYPPVMDVSLEKVVQRYDTT
jgi:hypothetical protein